MYQSALSIYNNLLDLIRVNIALYIAPYAAGLTQANWRIRMSFARRKWISHWNDVSVVVSFVSYSRFWKFPFYTQVSCLCHRVHFLRRVALASNIPRCVLLPLFFQIFRITLVMSYWRELEIVSRSLCASRVFLPIERKFRVWISVECRIKRRAIILVHPLVRAIAIIKFFDVSKFGVEIIYRIIAYGGPMKFPFYVR